MSLESFQGREMDERRQTCLLDMSTFVVNVLLVTQGFLSAMGDG